MYLSSWLCLISLGQHKFSVKVCDKLGACTSEMSNVIVSVSTNAKFLSALDATINKTRLLTMGITHVYKIFLLAIKLHTTGLLVIYLICINSQTYFFLNTYFLKLLQFEYIEKHIHTKARTVREEILIENRAEFIYLHLSFFALSVYGKCLFCQN